MQKRQPPLTAAMAAIRRQAPALIGFSLVANLLLLVSAIYMLQVYDRVLTSGSMDTLLWLTVAAFVVLAIYGLIEHARRLVLSRIGSWLENQLSAVVIRRSMEARLAGVGAEAGLKDVNDLRAFVGGEGILAFLDAPWTPVFLALIWLLHPALGVLAIAGVVILFACSVATDLVTRACQQRAGPALRHSQAAASRYVDGAETINPLGMTGTVLARWQARRGDAQTEQQRLAETTAAIANFSRAFRIALQMLTLGVGAYYVLKGEMSSGGMIAASIILGRAFSPIERSIGAWRSFVAARAAHRNLERLLGSAEPAATSVRLPRPQGRLAVEGLRYLAPQTRDPIVNNVSFELEPGQTCGIIGASGSGKSSLCRLLVGAWKPAFGHVRLDGAEVSAWDPEDLGQYIGYLPQQVELFPGTVAENIARMQDVDSASVIAAAKLAGVHEMILRLPDGYQTDVGLHGSRISLGQRQRLGLARALFGDPSFIVLDEPNSNLDSEGDQALIGALMHLKGEGRTVLIVTHQTMPLQLADKILALKEGSVAMYDTRDEVLKVIMGARRQLGVVAGSGAPSQPSRGVVVQAE